VIQLSTAGDYAVVFLVSAVAGLFGGLAAELLLNRNGETGTFEMPARKGALFDLGGFASLVIGAVVGVAILVVFPPQTTVVNGAGGSPVTTQAYDSVRLVATALVAGSAGGSVLTALQSRVVAAVNESRVQLTQAVGEAQLQQLADATKEAASSAIRSLAPVPPAPGGVISRGALGDAEMPGAVAGPGSFDASAEVAIASLAASIDSHTAQARAAISAASRPPS
jgi:hypothetical protein